MRGLGLHNPYWTQLIQHCQVILRQTHRSTPTRLLLEENMELFQVYVGSEITFWELPFMAYGCLALQGWIKHTWESMASSPLVLRGPSLTLPRQRQHDVYLMDASVDRFLDQDTLKKLNEC